VFQCHGICEGLDVLDRPTVDDVAHGKLDDLAAFGAGDVGDLE